MNVKLLRKVKRHILAEPKRFLMSTVDTYGDAGKETGFGGKFAKCGTAACIAGWTCILSGTPLMLRTMETAAKLLNLSDGEKFRLFEPGAWPQKFEAGTNDDGKKKTAEVAARRIEHFIKTKGRK